jgi:hypothetical protein
VALGTLQVGGQKVELFLSPEWARYFQSLNTQVIANGAALAQSDAHTALLGEAMEAPDVFPSPPGPPGMQGDPGLALFMLQDDAGEQPVPVPPCVDGVYVPLKSKDATDGVPGLTQLKLNLKNVAGTITSWFTTAATAARTWTMPDKDGTVAVLSDFASPPAIGNTTPATGRFTTVSANTGATFGAGTASVNVITNGADVGAASGVANILRVGGATVLGFGNKSALIGGAYDSTPYIYHVGVLTTSGAVAVTGGFGCNGKAAQTAAASGGTLAGVIAALVANGILSS